MSSNFHELSNQNLSGFVPALVIDYLLEKLRKKESRKLPEKQTFDSVVMFADISGFTNLAEKLSKRGPEGTELLAFTLNRYMELLVNAIGRSGGDIFKFAGDAIIIVWPPPSDKSHLVILCRQAIQSALDIQIKLTDFKIIDDVKLSVKIGFGVGQVTIAHVGGVFQRAEYLPAGPPLTQAFECEHLATGGGVVIVSRQVWEKCFDYFEFADLPGHHEGENSPFYFVKKVKKSVKMKADALLMKNNAKPSDIEAIRSFLKSYIPAAVVPYIEIDQEKWSPELRRLTVMFVNLGIDLKDVQSQEGLERIQIVIETVQKLVYSNQGSLNKFLMDDKGSTLIVLFGLPPMAHQDDPVRAVLTAHNLVKTLKKINCPCSIGITTGMVFAGVVGTSGNRREYSVLGDSVNLSARFMQAACQEKEKKVLVDEATKLEAEHKLRFRFVKSSTVKGKTGEIPFFEPVLDGSEKAEDFQAQVLKKIRIHHTQPLISHNAHNMAQESLSFIIGKDYESEMKKSFNLFEKFLSKPFKNCLIMITGPYGVGKSTFLRNFLEKMTKRIEIDKWKYNEKTSVLFSGLNCVEKNKKLNGLRSIFQEIFRLLGNRYNMYNENLLIKLLENEKDLLANLEMVADILNLKFIGEQHHERFSMKKRTEQFESKMIKRILLHILAAFFEDEAVESKSKSDDITDNDSESVIIKSNNPSMHHSKIDKENHISPLILVLDDMQDYDPLSWGLLKKMLVSFKKFFILASVRTEDLEPANIFKKSPFASTAANDSQQNTNKNETTSNASLSSIHLQKTSSEARIKLKSELYNGQPEEYIDMMIYELEETCENSSYSRVDLQGLTLNEIEGFLYKILGIKMVVFANNPNRNPDKFFKFLHDKTKGNPLDLLNYLANLIGSQYLLFLEASFILVINENLAKCIDLEEYLTIPTPLSRVKTNIPIFDHLPCKTKLLLKSASVIGECFDLQTLWKIIPFKETIGKDRLILILNELEKQEFIEVLDQNINNITYRFTLSFMREAIYQSIIYNHRRSFHRYVAEAIQSMQIQTQSNEKLETDKLILHWSIAEDKDPFQTFNQQGSADFSNKAKRSIIVKKISSLISKNPTNPFAVLKKGNLDKKSDKGYTWSKRFCLVTQKEFKYYYSEEGAKNEGEQALGAFALKNIYSIMPITEKEAKGKPFSFVIYVGSWLKKDKEMGIREFYFSAYSNDELEEWTTYIEFIKAKAIYDSFVNTFGKISFPLGNTNLENFDLDNDINVRKSPRNMSRLTLISQYNDGASSLINNNSVSKPINRKMTAQNRLLKRNTQANSLLSETQNELGSYSSAEMNKKLKERLINFFNNTFLLFWSHIIESSNKYALKESDPIRQVDGHNLGITTHLIRANNIMLKVEKTILEDPSLQIIDKQQQQKFTLLMNKLTTKSSLSSNGRQSGGGGFSESLEEINSLKEINDELGLTSKKTAKEIDKLEKIDEVSEARDSMISRTESLHTQRRGTGLIDTAVTLQKINAMSTNNINTVSGSIRKISDSENFDEKNANNNSKNAYMLSPSHLTEEKSKKNSVMGEIQEEIDETYEINEAEIEEKGKRLTNPQIDIKKEESLEIFAKEAKSIEKISSSKKILPNFLDVTINSNLNLISEIENKSSESIIPLLENRSYRSKKQETLYDFNRPVNKEENLSLSSNNHEKSMHKVVQRKLEKQKKEEVKRWTTVINNKNEGESPENMNYKTIRNFYTKTVHNKYMSYN